MATIRGILTLVKGEAGDILGTAVGRRLAIVNVFSQMKRTKTPFPTQTRMLEMLHNRQMAISRPDFARLFQSARDEGIMAARQLLRPDSAIVRLVDLPVSEFVIKKEFSYRFTLNTRYNDKEEFNKRWYHYNTNERMSWEDAKANFQAEFGPKWGRGDVEWGSFERSVAFKRGKVT